MSRKSLRRYRRLQRTFEYKGETKGIAVSYVTNRAIMSRLDEVVGPENWYIKKTSSSGWTTPALKCWAG